MRFGRTARVLGGTEPCGDIERRRQRPPRVDGRSEHDGVRRSMGGEDTDAQSRRGRTRRRCRIPPASDSRALARRILIDPDARRSRIVSGLRATPSDDSAMSSTSLSGTSSGAPQTKARSFAKCQHVLRMQVGVDPRLHTRAPRASPLVALQRAWPTFTGAPGTSPRPASTAKVRCRGAGKRSARTCPVAQRSPARQSALIELDAEDGASSPLPRAPRSSALLVTGDLRELGVFDRGAG